MRSALVFLNLVGARGRVGYELFTPSDCNSVFLCVPLCSSVFLCAFCGFFDRFVRVFLADGYWNAPHACVNGDTFRQDGRDTLRVEFFDLQIGVNLFESVSFL